MNAEAYRSLHQAGDDLLTLHRLNVSNTLLRSLFSTNAIENSFLNTRCKLGRVLGFELRRIKQAAEFLMRCLSQRRAFVGSMGTHLLQP